MKAGRWEAREAVLHKGKDGEEQAYDPEQTQSNKRKLVDQCREQEKDHTDAAGGSGVFWGGCCKGACRLSPRKRMISSEYLTKIISDVAEKKKNAGTV